MERVSLTYDELLQQNNELQFKLDEANDAIEAIRTGQVDALIVHDGEAHQLYTLKTADQTYRVFIEKMNEGAVTLNREGLILYSNSRFAAMVKMPLEKVIGLSFNNFVTADSIAKFNNLVSNAWEEDCKEEIDLEDTRKHPIPCLLSCTTLEFDEGPALSIILTDLTLLKDTERQLKIKNLQLAAAHLETEKLNNHLEDTVRERTNELSLSREHFKLLANNIPQMTWTNLPNGDADYYNQQWYNYTGLDLAGSKGSGWQSALHPDDVKATAEKFMACMASGAVYEMENRYKRAIDGQYRWHLSRAQPLRNEEGQIVFWAGTATDIEDQKKEMELKDEFIGIASHELKTPLTSLKGYLQLITGYQKEELPPLVKQYIAKANGSLNKLQRLVNDLLDVSKIKAGLIDYAFTQLNISSLVKACTENAAHIYQGHIFDFQDGTPLFIQGNAGRLEQVIMNLVNNAVKYAPDSKLITLSVSRLDGKVRVAVTDTGIGLSAEQIEHIFERFYRVEDKKHMASGLGMGLYISAEIIKHHQGDFGVNSEPGKGSTFYFDLPLA